MVGLKCFEMWWPGTELNRRRQPFQGQQQPLRSLLIPQPLMPFRSLFPAQILEHFGTRFWNRF